MKFLRLFLFFGCLLVGAAAEFPSAEHWLSKEDLVDGPLTDEETEIPADQFYECNITSLGTAIRDLKKSGFIGLSEEQAAYFAGTGYRPKKGT